MTAETKRTEGMRAITLHRPWSFAVARLGKDVENRGWRTNYRGLLAIHAGKTWDWRSAEMIERISGHEFVPWDDPRDPDAWKGVVAVANLVEVHGAEECGFGLSCSDWAFAHGWHWILTDIVALPKPVPCKGRQSLWRLPEDVERAVWSALAGER